MTMSRDEDTRKLALHIGHELTKLPGQGKADSIAECDIAHALFEDSFAHLQNEIVLGTRRIFQREIDVLSIGARVRHGDAGHLAHLVARLAQLHLAVQGRDADDRLDGRSGRDLDSLPRRVDITFIGASDRADLSELALRGYQPASLELARRGDGEAAIQGIEAHICQCLCDYQLLLWKVMHARRLFAVAQRRFVKFYYASRHC